ncbi:MAG: hypothetical protein FD167_375 [bacterium]|nr:MAG: hypothetical protein FD167_375 [bacterium]
MSSIEISNISSSSNVLASFDVQKTTKKEKNVNLNSLEKAANTLVKKAESTLSKDRQVNTSRGANMAENIEANARKELQLAKTILRLVEGIKAGETTYLSAITSKTQVELLQYTIGCAKNKRASKLTLPEWKTKNKSPQAEDADYATYPYPWVDSYSLKQLVTLSQSLIGLEVPLAKLSNLGCNLENDLTFDTPEKLQLLEIIIKQLRASSKYDAGCLLEKISRYFADYQRLSQIGISDLPTLIKALKEYCCYCSDVPKEDPIKKLERELINCKIPSFFPTPEIVVGRMLQLTNIEPFMRVLEPSAGKGSIADLIKKNHLDCNLSVIEINYTLREILTAKGYNLVGNDFLDHTESYDRVVQNPPFQKLQDIDHCRKAFSLLNPGGRLVSIVSESCFFREDKKAIEFRSWLEEVNAYIEKLPEGSFLESDRSTGVSTRIIVVDKPKNTDFDAHQDSHLTNNVQVCNNWPENFPESLVAQVDNSSLELAKMLLEIKDIVENPSAEDVNNLKLVVNKDQIADKVLHIHDYEKIKDSFLEHQEMYETIIISPTVYGELEIEHIYHAYYLLGPGGTLAVTLPETVISPSNKLYSKFHKWLRPLNPRTEPVIDGKCLVKVKKTTLF